MEISLPLYLNGRLQYRIVSERKLCSNMCLYGKRKFVAYHLPGLGGELTHLHYPLLTDSGTMVKKKRHEELSWKKLSYDYVINPIHQKDIYNYLSKNPVAGIVNVIDQCKCSLEMEFIEGQLSFKHSLPITQHYELNFQTKTEWDNLSFLNFLEKSVKALTSLHEVGIIHGDVSAQNFLLTNNGQVFLIDLDNVAWGNEQLYRQEWITFLVYTILPIYMSFESEHTIREKFSNALSLFDRNVLDWGQNIIEVFKNELKVKNLKEDVLSLAFYYNLDMIAKLSNDYYQLVQRLQQLQTELLESTRVKDDAMFKLQTSFQKQYDAVSNYAKSLEKNYEEVSNYAKSLEKNYEEVSNYAKSLEKNYEEVSNYAKSLEKSYDEVSNYAKSLEKELVGINHQLLELQNLTRNLNQVVEKQLQIIDEVKENITAKPFSWIFRFIKQKFTNR